MNNFTEQAPKRHVHADLIIAWANGATIQYKSDNEWLNCPDPVWKVHGEYRLKPEPTPWYENVPAQGVLCWVKDNGATTATMAIVRGYNPSALRPYTTDFCSFEFARPVAESEIASVLYKPLDT